MSERKSIPLACTKAAAVPAGSKLPLGVGKANCVACGAAVLVSPSSVAMIRNGRVEPMCFECIPKDRPTVAVMTGAQAAELRNWEAQRCN